MIEAYMYLETVGIYLMCKSIFRLMLLPWECF